MVRTHHTAVLFDAFGTLIKPADRRSSIYSRLVALAGPGHKIDRNKIMTRPVGVEMLAAEVGRPDTTAYPRSEIDREISQLSLYDDVAPVLRSLRGTGLNLGVCSNLGLDYGPVLHRLLPGLGAYTLSFEIGARKPEPAIFDAACQRLHCQPRDVLFVGDSTRADYEGPTAFGMTACLVDRPKVTSGQTVESALRHK